MVKENTHCKSSAGCEQGVAESFDIRQLTMLSGTPECVVIDRNATQHDGYIAKKCRQTTFTGYLEIRIVGA
jgi:hypothetical protein